MKESINISTMEKPKLFVISFHKKSSFLYLVCQDFYKLPQKKLMVMVGILKKKQSLEILEG